MNAGPKTVDHEMVLASLFEGVLVFGPDLRVRFVNQAAEALLGRSRLTLWGLAPAAVFERSTWIVDLVDRVSASENKSLRIEGPLTLADHSSEVVAEASPLRDRFGNKQGTVLTLYEAGGIQEIRKHDEARNRLQELDRLVASLGHEINNPLSGIRGAAQLLGRKIRDKPELVEYSEMIVRQVDRMGDLVTALMALEAPATEHRPLNIHRLLNEIVLLERPEAAEHGITIAQHFDPSLPEVLGDADQLQQVFLNIVKNAVRACRERGSAISITTRMETGFYVEREDGRRHYISVEVTDDGPGMDEDTIRHMFEPLYSRHAGGHGMGLAIAQTLVAAHGGIIRADNRESGGARFGVKLPVARALDYEKTGTDENA